MKKKNTRREQASQVAALQPGLKTKSGLGVCFCLCILSFSVLYKNLQLFLFVTNCEPRSLGIKIWEENFKGNTFQIQLDQVVQSASLQLIGKPFALLQTPGTSPVLNDLSELWAVDPQFILTVL